MTHSLTEVSARRPLLDRPQKLGILPTLWFWNDWAAQRLLLPFVFITAPLLILINVVQVWLRLSAWVPITANILIPFLTMGLVERHVRARLLAEKTADLPRAAPHDTRCARALMLSMALLSGVLTVLVLIEASAVILGATVLAGATLIAIVLRRGTPRARQFASGRKPNPPGLPASKR